MRPLLAVVLLAYSLGAAHAAPAPDSPGAFDRTVLPVRTKPFGDVAGRTLEASVPSFPALVRAPAGAPNVLLILTDDVGFGTTSAFGGVIPTPNLERLASQGVRFNRFHTTAMCSPTRAALLTGRNHHAVGTATVTDAASGFEGYSSVIPRSAATLAEVLRLNGWNTAMFGKHHNVPSWQLSLAGPFDLWPTGLGFEYFYGFLGGDTDQWHPRVYRNTAPVGDNRVPGKPRLLDEDLADEVIGWIHNQKAAAPDKPFFVYYAPGTAHAPHQAPREWIERFRGRFDSGWDVLRREIFERQKASGVIPAGTELPPREDAIPAWDSLGAEQKRHYARMMEVFAAVIAYQDAQVGRVLDEIGRMGIADDTLVVYVVGDNGASAEGGLEGSQNELGVMLNGVRESAEWRREIERELGGAKTYQLLPVGWSWALNTPFRWTKQVASHLGGTRNGMVMSWPAKIRARGELRSQFTHVVDVAPTVLEAVGVPSPATVNGYSQQPIDGVSFLYALDAPDAPERHTRQYFEMFGNRALYQDGWLASTTPARLPWAFGAGSVSTDRYRWELYDLRRDFAQAHDLAGREPERLAAMRRGFDAEAERNHVFPLDDRMGPMRAMPAMQAYGSRRTRFEYWGTEVSVAATAAPSFAARSFSVTAELDAGPGASGVLLAAGSHFGGWTFYLDHGRPVVHQALSQQPADQFHVAAGSAVPGGPATVRYDFDYDGGGPGRGGLMRISIDGREVGRGRIERTILAIAGLGETYDVGRDTGAPVLDYPIAPEFAGRIRRVEIVLR